MSRYQRSGFNEPEDDGLSPLVPVLINIITQRKAATRRQWVISIDYGAAKLYLSPFNKGPGYRLSFEMVTPAPRNI